MRRWEWVANFLQEEDPRFGAELGCKEGKFTQHLLKSFPELHMTAIDLFNSREQQDREGFETYDQWDFDAIQKEFRERTQDFNGRLNLLVMDTKEAAVEVNGLFDFIFIDAEHTYEGVTSDIDAWWPLVKEGGYVMGHDFNHKWPGVERAVADRFNLIHVILGDDSVWCVQK